MIGSHSPTSHDPSVRSRTHCRPTARPSAYVTRLTSASRRGLLPSAMVPKEMRGKLEPAEIFHEILEHRWFLSERAGHEIDIFAAARDYIRAVLANRPEEAVTASDDPDMLMPRVRD